MTFEEQLADHEQWLRSMESNHNQLAADLAAVTRNLAEVTRNQALFTATFAQAMARLTAEQERQAQVRGEFEAGLKALTERVNKLAQTVDRYIRFRGDGTPKN